MKREACVRIVFMGTPEFAVPCLDALYESEHELQCVVTVPDKETGRGLKMTPSAVKQRAEALKLPVLQPGILDDPGFVDALKNFRPDCIIVVAFRILPPSVFRIPVLGTINLHASLLPAYRGAAPINWAIIRGERETGITTFIINEKIDRGTILLQKAYPVGADETAGELSKKLSAGGADLIIDTLKSIRNGQIEIKNQSDGNFPKAPKLTKELCSIDWGKSARDIHNLVRGLSPVPGASSGLKGKRIKILRTKVRHDSGSHTSAPGAILSANPKDGFLVACGMGVIEIVELMQEGKKAMNAQSFLMGSRGLDDKSFQSEKIQDAD